MNDDNFYKTYNFYPTIKEIEIACRTIKYASEYEFNEILSKNEYNELVKNADLFLENFRKYKLKFIQDIINEVDNL